MKERDLVHTKGFLKDIVMAVSLLVVRSKAHNCSIVSLMLNLLCV